MWLCVAEAAMPKVSRDAYRRSHLTVMAVAQCSLAFFKRIRGTISELGGAIKGVAVVLINQAAGAKVLEHLAKFIFISKNHGLQYVVRNTKNYFFNHCDMVNREDEQADRGKRDVIIRGVSISRDAFTLCQQKSDVFVQVLVDDVIFLTELEKQLCYLPYYFYAFVSSGMQYFLMIRSFNLPSRMALSATLPST